MGPLGNIWAFVAGIFGFEFWGRLFAKSLVHIGPIFFVLLVIRARRVMDALAKRRRSVLASKEPRALKQPDYPRLKGPEET